MRPFADLHIFSQPGDRAVHVEHQNIILPVPGRTVMAAASCPVTAAGLLRVGPSSIESKCLLDTLRTKHSLSATCESERSLQLKAGAAAQEPLACISLTCDLDYHVTCLGVDHVACNLCCLRAVADAHGA